MPPKRLQNWAKESSNPKRTPGTHRPRFETPRSTKETAASNSGSNPITALASGVGTSVNAAISRIRVPKIAIAPIAIVIVLAMGICIGTRSKSVDSTGDAQITTIANGQSDVRQKTTPKPRAVIDIPGCPSSKYPTARDKADYLLDEYGIAADYLRTEDTQKDTDPNNSLKGYRLTPSNEQDFNIFLEKMCRAAGAYPKDIFSNNPKRPISLTFADQIIELGSNSNVGGFGGSPGISLARIGNITEIRHYTEEVVKGRVSLSAPTVTSVLSETDQDGSFDHEFEHVNDDSYNDHQHGDNPNWKKTTGKRGAYIGYHLGQTTRRLPIFTPGFAEEYGMSTEDEDQATIGEGLMSPSELKFLVLRAKTDQMLRNSIELMTGCVLDTKTGRFAKTMTEDEYKSFSGFDGYKYYLQWSHGTMDHDYWNKWLDTVSPDVETYAPRNGHDGKADLVYFNIALSAEKSENFEYAGEMYENAHEPILAQKMFRAAAEKAEKDGDFANAANYYGKAGNEMRANELNLKTAEKAVADGNFPLAALRYMKAGKKDLAHKYAAMAFSKASTSDRYHDDTLILIAEECYQWKSLPPAAVDFFRNNIGQVYPAIYGKLGDPGKMHEAAVAFYNRFKGTDLIGFQQMGESVIADRLIDANEPELAKQLYTDLAKALQSNHDILSAATAYRRAGDFVTAQKLYFEFIEAEQKKDDPTASEIASAYRGLADATAIAMTHAN